MNDNLRVQFNRSARAIEKCQKLFPEAVAQLNKSAVFEFSFDKIREVPQTLAAFGHRLSEAFFLPFPHTGVLNENTLVCLWDLDLKVKTIGIDKSRGFLLAMRCQGDAINVIWGKVQNVSFHGRRPATVLDGPNATTLTEYTAAIGISGVVEVSEDSPEGFVIFDGDHCYLNAPHDRNLPIQVSAEKKEAIMQTVLKQTSDVVGMSYLDIAYFNTPNRFVLEESPERMKPRDNATKVARAEQRPFYTLLTPGQIKKVMQIKGEHRDADGRKIHYRRAHTRYLGSDFFTHMQGETIFIKAVWNFDEMRVIDKKRYRVMVDV